MQSSLWSQKHSSVYKTPWAGMRTRLLNFMCSLLHCPSWSKNEVGTTECLHTAPVTNSHKHPRDLPKKQSGHNPSPLPSLLYQWPHEIPESPDVTHYPHLPSLHSSVHSLISIPMYPFPALNIDCQCD